MFGGYGPYSVIINPNEAGLYTVASAINIPV